MFYIYVLGAWDVSVSKTKIPTFGGFNTYVLLTHETVL